MYSTDSKPAVLSYGADGKPGGEFYDADISSRSLPRDVPISPHHHWSSHAALAIWIAAWITLIASFRALREAPRRS